MEIFMMDYGKMIKPMVKEFIIIMMAPNIWDNGKMIYNKVLEYKHGQMVQNMKENIYKAKEKGKEN